MERMDFQKLKKIIEPKDLKEKLPENEIRLIHDTTPDRYISRIVVLFQEKNYNEIIMKAAGKAIKTLCILFEIVRRSFVDLHSIVELANTTVVEKFEPIEEGKEILQREKNISILQIILKKSVTENDKKHSGYHAPLPENEINNKNLERKKRGSGGNFRRSNRNKYNTSERKIFNVGLIENNVISENENIDKAKINEHFAKRKEYRGGIRQNRRAGPIKNVSPGIRNERGRYQNRGGRTRNYINSYLKSEKNEKEREKEKEEKTEKSPEKNFVKRGETIWRTRGRARGTVKINDN